MKETLRFKDDSECERFRRLSYPHRYTLRWQPYKGSVKMKKEFGKPILYVECDDKVLMKAFMMQYKFYNELHLQEYRSWPYAVQFTKEQVGQWFLMSPKIMNVKGVRVVGKRDKGLRELYATGKLEDLEVLFKNIFKYLMRRRRRTPDEQKPSVDTAFTTHKIAADRARKRFV